MAPKDDEREEEHENEEEDKETDTRKADKADGEGDKEDEVEDDLEGKTVTVAHLKALRDHYDKRLAELSTDHSKTEEQRAALEQRIEGLQETLDRMLQREEEKEHSKDSKSTLVVPAKELDPQQQNKEEEEEKELPVGHPAEKKRRMRYY